GNMLPVKRFPDPKRERFIKGTGGRKGFGDGQLHRQVFAERSNSGSKRLWSFKGAQIMGTNTESHHTGSIKGFGKGVKKEEDGDDAGNNVD
ncbi:MAG TPA: hypothetical protein P5046_00440, partial [Sphaerochaeta sp.]|nr:hypothetical protein [Sphaerochaeta sp.]